ncbi:hypothetical protein C8Q80DRAFT_1148994 [Daedaleopsis nitida]|nr:hypothetical protein C8Q80DRAFT_1148994 [Daedaleopsis nitida]
MVKTRSSTHDGKGENSSTSSTKYSVTSAERFHNDLSSNVSMAWRGRASEHRLYTVYDHICSHLCNIVEPSGYPKNTISHTPQDLFGVEVPPAGSEPQAPLNKKELYEERFPDFARHIFCSSEYLRLLIDCWEIKGLNIPASWDSEQARRAALKAISGEMEQVFVTAMAGFAHNPNWEHVHALLIIGVYFSQFVWTRPEGEIERALSDISINHVLTKEEMQNVMKRYEDRITQFKSRALPKVQFYNAPVFKFHTPTDDHPIRVTLSPEFLFATRLPLKKHFKSCKIQSSWLSPPSRKPCGWPKSVDPDVLVRLALIDSHVALVKNRIRNLRHQSATPANPKESPGYKPDHRLKASLQKSPLAGKVARPRRVIPGVKRGAKDAAHDVPAPAQEQKDDGQAVGNPADGESNHDDERPVEDDPGEGGMLSGDEADDDADRQSDGEDELHLPVGGDDNDGQSDEEEDEDSSDDPDDSDNSDNSDDPDDSEDLDQESDEDSFGEVDEDSGDDESSNLEEDD